MRIASLLPSATEIVFAVGAGTEVVGVSHGCDYPAEACGLPVLTGPAVETRGLPQAEIDAAVSGLLAAGGSTYTIDVPRLRELRPDLVITQALCDICAVSERQVHRVVHEEQLGARVLTLTPLDLEGVARSLEEVGEAAGRPAERTRLAAEMRRRMLPRARVARTPAAAPVGSRSA
ncbi:MAG: ABC transporter substrate-binding protein [Chloroflexi bacterium]|nr:ABC transporter substrate-binding protein [Chloroflexota bacterium]